MYMTNVVDDDDEKAHNYLSHILFCPRNCKYLRNNLNIFYMSMQSILSSAQTHIRMYIHTHISTYSGKSMLILQISAYRVYTKHLKTEPF